MAIMRVVYLNWVMLKQFTGKKNLKIYHPELSNDKEGNYFCFYLFDIACAFAYSVVF